MTSSRGKKHELHIWMLFRWNKSLGWLTLFVLAVFPATAHGKVRLAAIFGDKMMLQRDSKASIWGYADPGEQLTLTFTDGNVTASASAGSDGRWIAAFNHLRPGGPFDLTVHGKDDTIVVHDVLVGDVWICSGQSNMEYQLKDDNELTAPEDSQFRYLLVPKDASLDPKTEIQGKATWVSASPATRATFTAVGYYFGKRLRLETGVPIGLIHTSWGGTAAELWMPKEALDAIPEFKEKNDELINAVRTLDTDAVRFADEFSAWEKRYGPIDPGNKGFAAGWANSDFDASDWKTITNPGDWSDFQMPHGGVIWLRRTIPVPPDVAGKDLKINLDVVPGFDTTYFNGEQVGKGGMDPPYFWGGGRAYTIPGRLVKEGNNVLAIRIVSQTVKNHAFGYANRLSNKLEGTTIPPTWQATVETAFAPMPPDAAETEPKPPTAKRDGTPTVLFNTMVLPLIPYGIKGVIWYQGEANVNRGYNYRTILPALIESWRSLWGLGEFPFYFVQLANLGNPPKDPNAPPGWAELRESQLMTWEKTPNTGMAVTIDIGDAHNIHPADKLDVGERLALFALANAYKKKVEDSGPVFKSMKITGNKIRLKFSHVGTGLIAKDNGTLKMFTIAGEDRVFHWADAIIKKDEVIVSCKDVPSPVAVRYAWFSNPEGSNLYNRNGLPASPFRTDTWTTPTESVWW